MDTKQLEAIRIAEWLEGIRGNTWPSYIPQEAAAELRRLQSENEQLRAGYDAARQEIASLRAQHEGGKSEALADLAYAHGMTTGWNLCIADKHDEFARIRSMRSSQAISTIEAPQPAAQPTIVQMKDYCKQASTMMARDLTRFDAACEVIGYLKEMRAPGYYMHRMNIVLHGNVEGTDAARASDKAAQPAAQDALAYQAACSLATRVFKKHFSKDVEYASGKVTWGLCDTTAGVISQIDNMVCGLVEPAAQAQEDALRCAVGNCKFNGEVDKHSPNCANTAAPVKRTVWVNLYGRQLESVCHPTEEDADKHASPNRIGGKAYPLEIEE